MAVSCLKHLEQEDTIFGSKKIYFALLFLIFNLLIKRIMDFFFFSNEITALHHGELLLKCKEDLLKKTF